MYSKLFRLLLCLSSLVGAHAGLFRYKWPTDDADNGGLADRLRKCDELKDAIKTFYHDYIEEQAGVNDKEYLRKRIKSITGVDFNSNRQLTRLACKLTDVKNLQQLARVLKLPLQLVVKYYNLFKDMVREHGGPEGMARLVDLWEVTVPAAKQVGLPHWPINCSYELAYDFFAHVIHDFGNDFIMDFLRPYATEQLELNNIDTFVRELLASTSIEDFAIRVGLNPDILQFFQNDLEIYTSDNYPFEKTMKQARAEVILARALEKLGLLDLKLRQKSRSKSRKLNGYYYPKYYQSADVEKNNRNRYTNSGKQSNSDIYYNELSDDYNRNRNEFDGYKNRKHGSKNYYRNEQNNDYYNYRKYTTGSKPTGSSRNNNYYNRKYDTKTYDRYDPYDTKQKQLGYYYNTKSNAFEDKGRKPQYMEFEKDKSKENKGQIKNDKNIYNKYESTSDENAGDESTSDLNANLPKYITYKWNTKPKEKSKSPYYYG